jgi:hypothetical protein
MNGIQIATPGVITNPAGLVSTNPLWSLASFPGVSQAWDSQFGITLDAANADATARTNVLSWKALIGTNTLVGVAANYPKFNVAMNGLTVPNFQAQYLRTNTDCYTAGNKQVFFAVFDFEGLTPVQNQCLFSCEQYGVYLMSTGNNNKLTLLANNVGTALGQASVVLTAGPHVLVIDELTAGTLEFRLDGVVIATFASPGVIAASTNAHATGLGNYWGFQPTFACNNTSIAAFGFAVAGTQSLKDIQKLEGYLAQRYISQTFLPAAHPYRSTAPRKLN